MSEMVQRVARAMLPIFRNNGIRISSPDDGDLDDLERERWETLIFAVEVGIKAMRHPTDGMLMAALNAGAIEGRTLADRLQEKDRIPVIVVVGHGSIYAKAYEAAIDEALK